MNPVIDTPIQDLPYIDEHGIGIEATDREAWDALIATLPKVFDKAYAAGTGRWSGSSTAAEGRARQDRLDPARLRRRPRRATRRPGTARPAPLLPLRADLPDREDRDRRQAAGGDARRFPGHEGPRLQRLVIGTRGHVLIVRRVSEGRAVTRRARLEALDSAALGSTLDPGQWGTRVTGPTGFGEHIRRLRRLCRALLCDHRRRLGGAEDRVPGHRPGRGALEAIKNDRVTGLDVNETATPRPCSSAGSAALRGRGIDPHDAEDGAVPARPWRTASLHRRLGRPTSRSSAPPIFVRHRPRCDVGSRTSVGSARASTPP